MVQKKLPTMLEQGVIYSSLDLFADSGRITGSLYCWQCGVSSWELIKVHRLIHSIIKQLENMTLGSSNLNYIWPRAKVSCNVTKKNSDSGSFAFSFVPVVLNWAWYLTTSSSLAILVANSLALQWYLLQIFQLCSVSPFHLRCHRI